MMQDIESLRPSPQELIKWRYAGIVVKKHAVHYACPMTVDEYIEQVDTLRRPHFQALVETIRAHLPDGFQETIQYRMPSWSVPHHLYPKGYHVDPAQPLPFLSVAAQKRHIAVYHMGLYADEALLGWFREQYAQTMSTRLDMGKSCIRFKTSARIPFELMGRLCSKVTPLEWIALYEKRLGHAES